MKKINYVASLFMAFSAASTSSTAFADQIEDLTDKIVKSKAGDSLLETAQQLVLKMNMKAKDQEELPRKNTRSFFRGLISAALGDLEKDGGDLSKVTPELIHNVKNQITRHIEANEVDELEIMAREEAIRTNEHGKKKVRKSKEAAEVVKREERDEDISSVSASEESPSSSFKAGEVVKREERDEEISSVSASEERLGSSSKAGEDVNREESQENKESSFVNRSPGSKSSKNNGNSDFNARKSERARKVSPKLAPEKCVGCVNSKNNRSEDSNTRKSERTRKGNPKYSSD